MSHPSLPWPPLSWRVRRLLATWSFTYWQFLKLLAFLFFPLSSKRLMLPGAVAAFSYIWMPVLYPASGHKMRAEVKFKSRVFFWAAVAVTLLPCWWCCCFVYLIWAMLPVEGCRKHMNSTEYVYVCVGVYIYIFKTKRDENIGRYDWKLKRHRNNRPV